MSTTKVLRPGEYRLPFDPAAQPDATLCFIGQVRSPWAEGTCPKNLDEARSRGGTFALMIDPPFRPALTGLLPGMAVIVLTFLDRARRDLILQAPSHRPAPTGTFALRSPARPNPIGLAITRITLIGREEGRIGIEAIDAYDGTPLIDLKPWIAAIDLPPGA